MNIHQALSETTEKLKKASPSPLFDAEILLAHTLKQPREFVSAHPEKTLNKNQKAVFKKMIARRSKNEPVAYILGHKEFYGLDFKVNRHTLIPRPETELLVGKSLFLLRSMLRNNWHNKIAIIDIGTGSGNIIISIAKNLRNKNNYFGIDISAQALQVAKHNAKKNGVENKIKFAKSDLLNYFFKNNSEIKKFDELVILANLPYLDKAWKNLLKSSESAGLKYEPKTALDGGIDGLDFYRQLAKQIKEIKEEYPYKKIRVFCEIGHLQKKTMSKIFSFAKSTIFHKDLAGKWRIAEIML